MKNKVQLTEGCSVTYANPLLACGHRTNKSRTFRDIVSRTQEELCIPCFKHKIESLKAPCGGCEEKYMKDRMRHFKYDAIGGTIDLGPCCRTCFATTLEKCKAQRRVYIEQKVKRESSNRKKVYQERDAWAQLDVPDHVWDELEAMDAEAGLALEQLKEQAKTVSKKRKPSETMRVAKGEFNEMEKAMLEKAGE